MARTRVLDVPGHESRSIETGPALCVDVEPQFRRPPGLQRPHASGVADHGGRRRPRRAFRGCKGLGVGLSEQTSSGSEKWPLPLLVGVILSGVWLFILGLYLAQTAMNDSITNWRTFLSAKPDMFGNALAGAFAPLAFLWLVVATFLQRDELVQNRRALMLQAKELSNSVEQSTLQTKLLVLNREGL